MYTLNINNPEKFFCPKTGEQLYGHNFGCVHTPAVEFYFLKDISDFSYIKPEYEELYEQCEEEAEETEKSAYKLFMEKFNGYEDFILFSITYGPGPFSSTVDICINMSYEDPSEEEEDNNSNIDYENFWEDSLKDNESE